MNWFKFSYLLKKIYPCFTNVMLVYYEKFFKNFKILKHGKFFKKRILDIFFKDFKEK